MTARLAKQGYPTCFLDTQYLINPSIAFFPSYKFYSAKLKSGIDNLQSPLVEGFNWPNPNIGIVLIDIEAEEEANLYSLQNHRYFELTSEKQKQQFKF